eukprot:gene27854-56623_t
MASAGAGAGLTKDTSLKATAGGFDAGSFKGYATVTTPDATFGPKNLMTSAHVICSGTRAEGPAPDFSLKNAADQEVRLWSIEGVADPTAAMVESWQGEWMYRLEEEEKRHPFR